MSSDRHVVCTKCASVNRVPASRQASDARCGKCHERLFDGHPADVNAALFDRLLERNSLPVLVDVWAPWCGPCLVMAPAYQAAAQELEPEIRLVKLNSDAEQSISNRLGIRGIPTLILFRGNAEVARTSGAMSAPQIVKWVRQRLQLEPA
jgi:thioredoxin 2